MESEDGVLNNSKTKEVLGIYRNFLSGQDKPINSQDMEIDGED